MAPDLVTAAGESLLVRYGNFLFRRRNLVFPAVLVLLLAAFRPRYPGASAALDVWLDVLGLAVVLAGQGLRAAVIGLAYIKRGGLNKRVYAEHLVTEGLFAHCRNPLYVGNLAIVLGFLVIHNSPWVYLLGTGFFLVSYAAIVAAEERFLNAKFGAAYARYCHDVPRWRIAPRGLPATFKGMTFNWRRVIIKDYSTVMTWLVTVLGLFAWQSVAHQGLAAARDILIALALAVLVTIAAALAVRWLKKTRRLTERPLSGTG